MSESKGIKEISELIDGLEVIGVAAAKVLADGKVNALDLPAALELIKSHEKLIAAATGLDELLPEGKDIDSVEAIAIVQKLIAAGKAIKDASKVQA